MNYIVDGLSMLLKFIYGILNGFSGNNAYGFSIIIFTVLIRLCLFPLYYKQTHSMRKMQVLQPKMNKIQEKYKGKTSVEDKQKMQLELSELYKEAGTNPFSGCLPLIIQLPILWSLYRVLFHAKIYLKDIKYNFFGFNLSWSPQKALSTAHDYKYVGIVIVAAATTFLAFKLFQTQPQTQQNSQTGGMNPNQMMNTMLIFSTCMTGLMAFQFPSGMGVYWITYNLFQLCQQYTLYRIFNKDDNKEGNSNKANTAVVKTNKK